MERVIDKFEELPKTKAILRSVGGVIVKENSDTRIDVLGTCAVSRVKRNMFSGVFIVFLLLSARKE